MKCPLTLTGVRDREDITGWAGDDCLEEECAWWCEPMGCCEVEALRRTLKHVAEELAYMVEKMPHADQFTK
uniref:Uncharacterized protein n=1 Tax=viral metagenome TaxID=1070528 RepID=A0A6H2A4X5_9ZZZZ